MKGIYLACGRALHPNYDIIYQDYNGSRDVGGDMMNIDLRDYDYIIASPPCNYWSRANYRRNESDYALSTKHLLPAIIWKLYHLGKPFIVENVRNFNLMRQEFMSDLPFDLFIFTVGRHTYFTNVCFDIADIEQRQDFTHNSNGGCVLVQYDDMDLKSYRQGGYNVHNVIERWLQVIHKNCI